MYEPKKAYDKIGLEKILLDPGFRTIDENGRVLPPSNDVYKTISQMMSEKGSKITAKHIHTIINNNRNGFKDRITNFFDIKPEVDSIAMDKSSGLSSEQSTDTDIVKIVNLVISSEKWKSIDPVEKEYGKRFYWKLRAGWADVVAEAMWVQHNLSCVFVSKNNTVNKSAIARYYLTFDGNCRECSAKIRGTLLKEPAKDVDVILKVTIEGLQPQAHTGDKRRQLRGVRRQRVADSLIDTRKDAITWRRKEAARLKVFGGKNPPTLPTNAVLRKAKEQRLIEAYGLEFSNPALNLIKNAEHGKYVGCIHHVALLKFNCVYWRPEQLQIYVARCRKNENAQFIIDATGGVAKRDQSHDPHIFLYQCVLVTNEGSVPVFQMVSADQRALIVAHFLRLILATNAPIPPIVVTDFGWALLIAVAEIFGKCASISDYLQKCYDALNNRKIALPSTYIRLDVCHLSAMVSRWPCLKGKSLVGRFFKHCVGQASKLTDLDDLAYFLESVLVVALSKYIGCDATKKQLESDKRVKFLNDKIKGEPCLNTDEENENVEKNDFPECNEYDSEHYNVGWKSWANDIFNRARRLASNEGETINACYSEDFAGKLKKHLLPYVPLWTAVMVPIFRRGGVTATSAAVESEFGDIKNRDFKGELPMRVDRFVLQHLERIDEKIKERSKESDVRPETPAVATNSGSLSQSEISFMKDTKNGTSTPNEWSVQENWRGLTKTLPSNEEIQGEEPMRKRKKLAYFDDCPEWEFVKDAQASRIPVLMNGSTLAPVRFEGCEWNITETCAFDAIFHVIINGMAINNAYKEMLGESHCPLVKLATNVACAKKITKHHYTVRAEILSKVYFLRNSVGTFPKNVRRLVARCNVAHLAQALLDQEPSVKIVATCQHCKNEIKPRSFALLDVNVDILLGRGLDNMQAAIDDCASIPRICQKCANPMVGSAEYGPHLFVDTAIMTDPGYPIHDCSKKRHTLCSISKRINLGGRTYFLTGIVAYIAEMSHYVAYTLTGDIWYKYDDLIKKRATIKEETEVVPHLIIYVIHGSQKHVL